MRALIRKELAQLLPVALLFLTLFLLDGVMALLVTPVDQMGWSDILDVLKPDSSRALSFFHYLFGFSLAFCLFPREYEDGTIAFLHTLPISRRGIFLAKWGAAQLLILGVVSLTQVFYFALHLVSADSMGYAQFHLATAVTIAALWGLVAGLGLAHGLLLSFGRNYGLLVWATLAWLVTRFETLAPRLMWLDPTRLGAARYYGVQLEVAWSDALCHLLAALVCLVLAERLWSGRGGQATRAYSDSARALPGRFALGCAGFLIVIFLAIVLIGGDSSDDKDETFQSFQTARLVTRHYQFTFPVNLRNRAVQLAGSADRIYEAAVKALNAPEGPPIVADLTDVSYAHLGIASKGKMRVDITQDGDPKLLEHILFHETCHVLAHRIAGKRLQDYTAAASFFSEGSSEYEAFEAISSKRSRRASRQQAVAMWSRHKLKFTDLTDPEKLMRHLDEGTPYTLGEIWVAALVDVYGPTAPGRVYASIGRPDGPDIRDPVVFWQDTLQAEGFSFERVRAAWLRRLKQLETEEADFLARLPRLTTTVSRDGEGVWLEVRADRALPKDWRLVARVRKNAGSKTVPLTMKEGRFYVGDNPGSFDYQAGVDFNRDAYPFVETWHTAHSGKS
ncbi:MAG: ABC transporter permease [Candidatus Eremiobacteraeota bacterium]|nr:ABC transporter permease [Candidatus Eremiobacteraeota bacterium]